MADMSLVAAFGILICLSYVSYNSVGPVTDAQKVSKDIPAPKLSNFAGPTLRFLYCYSWGYKKVFEQFAHAIQQKYPDLYIEGDNYPPPPTRALVAQAMTILKMVAIACIIAGQNPFTWLNMDTPNIYTWALENKFYSVLMIFFISNAIEGQMISTGAFEIIFNDVPVWSKLDTGRIPSYQEMLQIIDNHMRLQA